MSITRRTALTALALPALPSVALARQAEPDPAVIAFHDWRAARMATEAIFLSDHDDADAHRAIDVEKGALDRLATTRATSLCGIRLQLLAALAAMGETDAGDVADPLSWTADMFGKSGYSDPDAGENIIWRVMEATEAMGLEGMV